MAGWDKIRAAAQRPDCIFSAFPDGTDGAMYHPRTSADDTFTKMSDNILIDNGVFATTGNGGGRFQSSKSFLGGRSHDLTLIAKFTADVPAGEVQYYVAPLACGSVGGSHWGIAVQGGKKIMDGTHFNMYAACALKYTKTDGTTATGQPSCGSGTLLCNKWHTMAMTVPITQYANGGRFAVYVDGENIFSIALTAYISNALPETIMTALPDNATVVNEMRTAGYVLKTKWAMAFNRALSAEEIKYLSED